MLSRAVVLSSVLLLSGCVHKIGRPTFPLYVDSNDLKTVRARILEYRGQNPDGSPGKPFTLIESERNDLQNRLLGISDQLYQRLKARLEGTRDTLAFVGETSATSLSSIAALVDGDPRISTAAALTTATVTSAQKNFYKNSTNAALIAVMDAKRAELLAKILDHQKNDDVDSYGLERMLLDCIAYDNAGQLSEALIQLGADAAAQKADQEKKVMDAR